MRFKKSGLFPACRQAGLVLSGVYPDAYREPPKRKNTPARQANTSIPVNLRGKSNITTKQPAIACPERCRKGAITCNRAHHRTITKPIIPIAKRCWVVLFCFLPLCRKRRVLSTSCTFYNSVFCFVRRLATPGYAEIR